MAFGGGPSAPGGPHSSSLAHRGQRPLRIITGKVQREMQRRPLLFKMLPCAFGFAFGDGLTQYMNRPARRGEPHVAWKYDVPRTLAMGAMGAAVAGPVGFAFVRWMDAHMFVGSSAPASLTGGIKFTLDQVVGCLIWQVAFLSINEPQRQAARRLLSRTSDRIRQRTLPALGGN